MDERQAVGQLGRLVDDELGDVCELTDLVVEGIADQLGEVGVFGMESDEVEESFELRSIFQQQV